MSEINNAGNIFQTLGNRDKVSKIIAQQIEEAIISKHYLPGSKLPSESELCSYFGVSRTSVREAIQSLAAQGLVSINKGKGIFVNELSTKSVSDPIQKYLKQNLSRDFVMDIVHARQMLEPNVAAQAALNHTNEDIIRLQNDIDEMENHEGDYKALAKLDMSFHINLAKASQNVIVPLLLEPIYNLIPDIKSSVYQTIVEAKEYAVKWHTKILDAVINNESTEAHDAMLQHLRFAEEHAERMLNAKNNN
jgi:GntR family transcriptional repressor for pyruvate dehydrogenase complex